MKHTGQGNAVTPGRRKMTAIRLTKRPERNWIASFREGGGGEVCARASGYPGEMAPQLQIAAQVLAGEDVNFEQEGAR